MTKTRKIKIFYTIRKNYQKSLQLLLYNIKMKKNKKVKKSKKLKLIQKKKAK